jgi:hypothetical protein
LDTADLQFPSHHVFFFVDDFCFIPFFLWFSSDVCAAILDLDISHILVLHLFGDSGVK